MVSAGPRPGSTPIAVPSVVPSRHHMRLTGVKATENPCARWLSVSMASASQHTDNRIETDVQLVLDEAGADVDAERPGEAEIGGKRKDQAEQHVTQRMSAAKPVADENEHDHRGCGEAKRLDQNKVRDQSDGDDAHRLPVGRRFLFFLR